MKKMHAEISQIGGLNLFVNNYISLINIIHIYFLAIILVLYYFEGYHRNVTVTYSHCSAKESNTLSCKTLVECNGKFRS